MLKPALLYPIRNILHINPAPILAHLRGCCVSNIILKRGFAEKSDKPTPGPAKEERISIKMPGFIHPENIKEEGYFTQKAKQQLEELKRRGDLPFLDSDKKD